VIAMLAFGAGQVTGTAAVPRLIGRTGARNALLTGATTITLASAALTATPSHGALAAVTLAGLGLGVGLTIVPQQHRLFATVPRVAPVAVGLNGSAIYTASALGAGLGGLVLAAGGDVAPPVTAALVAGLAVLIGVAVVPERMHDECDDALGRPTLERAAHQHR
jgi:MFS transporter, DHA1 family, inner membrane transport protein